MSETTNEPKALTTSDSASRSADVNVQDVAPDPVSLVNKPSDAGAERYPFPPAGDVDVATVSSKHRKGETEAPLTLEDWVWLDGSDERVPDYLDGRRAAIIAITVGDDGTESFEVRTRDEYNATLYIDRDAVTAIDRGGRTPTVRG